MKPPLHAWGLLKKSKRKLGERNFEFTTSELHVICAKIIRKKSLLIIFLKFHFNLR